MKFQTRLGRLLTENIVRQQSLLAIAPSTLGYFEWRSNSTLATHHGEETEE